MNALMLPEFPKLPPLSLSPEAVADKVALLTEAQKVVAVTTSDEQAVAAKAAGNLRSRIKEVREQGLALRRPVNERLKEIKEVEDGYVGELDGAQRRIERLVLDFNEKERRRVAEEERKRQEELDRLKAEREAAEAKAREAADKMQSDADLAEAIRKEEEARRVEAERQAALRAPMPEVNKPKGMSVRKVMCWEVTDIHALYKARPDLVRMEPNAAGIQATCVPEQPVPGLSLSWEERAVTAARRR